MSERMIVTKDGQDLIIRSGDIEIKQAIWSWGSCGTGLPIKEHPEFYGRDVDPRSPPVGTVLHGDAAMKWALDSPDDLCWEWRLGRESADDLVQMMKKALHPDSPYRLTVEEDLASEYVIEVLTRALEE